MERSKRGKRGKAKSGYVLVGNRPPYGYRVKSEPHKSWLEVDEEEAKIVRMVLDWYVHGDQGNKPLSINGIARRLTTLRIPTRGDIFSHVAKKFGPGIWQPAMIKHILTNEAYIGTWYFGKTHMSGEFSKELLIERKSRLEKTLADQKHFRDQLAADLQIDSITDTQIAEIEAFCAEVREGLDSATFEDKRKYIELLDVRGKLAIENDEKVVYVRCLLGKQRVSVVPTSPSSNTGGIAITLSAFPSTIRSP